MIFAEVLEHGEYGERTIRFQADGPLRDVLENLARCRCRRIFSASQMRTIVNDIRLFCRGKRVDCGAYSGIAFYEAMLERCREAGAEIAEVTLHVGWERSRRCAAKSERIGCTKSISRSRVRSGNDAAREEAILRGYDECTDP